MAKTQKLEPDSGFHFLIKKPIDSLHYRSMGFLYEGWKCLLDLIIVIPTLILIWPLFLLVIIIIKLDSPGPIIHRRRVVGRYGREFDAFKFRTMFVDGDAILANYPKLQAELRQKQKLKCDPRVTEAGKFLRKTSLDELPQLFNILRREMTLVGPRILTQPEIRFYGRHAGTLLSVTPGLTGLWQVSGRADTTFAERVRLDMHYIHNWSPRLDMEIMARTIPAVINGRGAY
ncbi:MAG: sugar transferase [Anaerolineae bacterium]